MTIDTSKRHGKMEIVRTENEVDIFQCDNCGTEFGDGSVCPKCGTLVANPLDVFPDPICPAARAALPRSGGFAKRTP